MGQLEARTDLAFRCYCRTGSGLVHGSVLCVVLSADGVKGEFNLGELCRRHCPSFWYAPLCVDGLTVRSRGTQMDHDAGMSTGSSVISSDLSGHAACGGLKRRDCAAKTEPRHRRDHAYAADDD